MSATILLVWSGFTLMIAVATAFAVRPAGEAVQVERMSSDLTR